MTTNESPLFGVTVHSKSDWETMRHAAEVLAEFGVLCESRVVSSHRTVQWMREYAATAESRGLQLARGRCPLMTTPSLA